MKVEYKNIKVNEKHKVWGTGYKYSGTLDVVVTKGLLWESTKTYPVSFSTPSSWRDCIYYTGSEIGCSAINRKDIGPLVIEACLNSKTKAKGDCCASPDLVVCNTYPLHDIILCHILDNYEVQDFSFKKIENSYSVISGNLVNYSSGYIVFKDNNLEYKYLVDLCDTVYEYACLNCDSIIKRDEEYAIKNFNEWFKEKQKDQKRIQKAKEICERNSLNE